MLSTGLGSLLTCQFAGGLDKKFYAWLLSRIHPQTLGFLFRDGETRYIDRSAVLRILGILSGPKQIKTYSGKSRIRLVAEVQGLLGMRVNTSAGITLDDLKAVLHNRDPDSLDLEEAKADKVAYTLLTCSTFVAPRQAGIHLPDELLECVLVPENIGQYDWAGYILEQVRAAAEKFQLAYHEEMRSFTLQGCIPLVKVKPVSYYVSAVSYFQYYAYFDFY